MAAASWSAYRRGSTLIAWSAAVYPVAAAPAPPPRVVNIRPRQRQIMVYGHPPRVEQVRVKKKG